VREALIRNGVEPRRLDARGYGADQPHFPNTSAATRAKNRRIELIIVSP
jgi:outer membrane protein OmpA-like peptidoglycan-associated protein